LSANGCLRIAAQPPPFGAGAAHFTGTQFFWPARLAQLLNNLSRWAFMSAVRTILVLAPHTDDGEFGCGGTIARFVEEGVRVFYAAFSAAEQSVLPHLPRDILRTEVRLATAKLGVASDDCLVLGFEVRRFPEQRQQILDALIDLSRRYRPDIVLLPSHYDTHQDHRVIAEEGFRAFKRTTMMGYELPWNNLDFRTSGFIPLAESHVAAKIRALKCYESQAHRAYASGEFINALAIARGTQIGVRYAEAFEVIRYVAI
jgi:LmbE family N-acetylglucosaminyl deacetylase